MIDERAHRPPSPGFRDERRRNSPPRFPGDTHPDRFRPEPERIQVFEYDQAPPKGLDRGLPLNDDRVPPLHNRATDERVRPVEDERRRRETHDSPHSARSDDRRDRRLSPQRDGSRSRGSPRRDHHGTEHSRRSDSRDRDRDRDHRDRHGDRRDRDRGRDHSRLSEPSSSHRNSPRSSRDPAPIPAAELKPEIFSASDILDNPGRESRPKNVRKLELDKLFFSFL